MVQQICKYQITIKGIMDHKMLQKFSPYEFEVQQENDQSTTIVARFDQSGLMGLIRFLHSRSFVFLTIQRNEK